MPADLSRRTQLTVEELESYCVLVCDDNPANLQVMADLLKPFGFKLKFASDGPSCIERAASQKADLILLDVQMPGMDGFETCKILKSRPDTSAIPVIFLTAFNETEHKVKGFEAGGVDYIPKPINRDELMARIRTHLRLLQLQRSLEQVNQDLEAKVRERTRQLHEAYHQGIESLARAVELRDQSTGGHSERVAELSVRMARALGFKDEAVENIRHGALLHDFGKIGISDSVLLKKGPLDAFERHEMQNHPQIGYDILKELAYLGAALDIPWCHHEKWDGSGYPRGLKGEAIPLSARLFAVVDVWDALSTDRPYRKALARQECLDTIRSLSGSHFDPELVRIFLELVDSNTGP